MQNKLFLALLLFSATNLSAQSDSVDYFKNRIFTGGNMGAWFGTQTYLNLSPIVGYRITNDFHAGIGVTYVYYKDNLLNYSTNVLGGSIFSRYFVLENLYLHAEVERLYVKWSDGNNYFVNNIYGGGGYTQRLGRNFSTNILVLWNFNQSPYSPYQNPIIRIGFGVGF